VIDTDSGALSSVDGSPFAAGIRPVCIAVAAVPGP
jgi:hypothetical protein